MRFPSGAFFGRLALIVLMLAAASRPARAQVSPAEILNPQLQALETEHLQKLIALNRQISAAKFPFKFVPSRFVGVDPKDQAALDKRGLEFVRFHERILLKCSGNYNAAFNAKQLSRNQRASQVFTDVAAPILRMLPPYFAEEKERDFEAIGFEISYHVREASGHAEYEGRENLVVILAAEDAFRFSKLTNVEDQQNVLNNSEIYLSGERYGLALGKVDPLSQEELLKPVQATQGGTGQGQAGSMRTFSTRPRSAGTDFRVPPGGGLRSEAAGSPAQTPAAVETPALTPADVDELETKYKSALEEYGKFVKASLHSVDYTAPDLASFRNSLYLQLTLRNPEAFDKEKTSLYKRAALSFDTFLAPHVRDLLSKLPAIPNLAGINMTVLVHLSSGASSSEAVEFICPLPALRKFASYEISNQDLIDQSLVIVNGVRISLKLQQVE